MRYSYKNPKILFHGKRIDVLSVEEGTRIREVVAHPGAVVILPLLDEETVVLVKNERYVVRETLWELPAGTLEENEDPKACAQRELLEETGYTAKKIEPLLNFFSTPGFCNEKLFVFLAKDLTFSQQQLDETEKIEPITLKYQTALDMIQNGEIHDSKTIAALLFYHTYSRIP